MKTTLALVLCASVAAPTLSLAATIAPDAAPQAQAQPPASPPFGGPVIAGVCVLSRDGVLNGAKVGKAATARLQEIQKQVESELSAEDQQLQADAKALDAKKSTLAAGELAAKRNALGQRLNALKLKSQVRQREIELTRLKALNRIAQEVDPVVHAVYTSHSCGLLFERAALIGGNLTNDLTPEVVAGVDARISTITFDREVLQVRQAPAK